MASTLHDALSIADFTQRRKACVRWQPQSLTHGASARFDARSMTPHSWAMAQTKSRHARHHRAFVTPSTLTRSARSSTDASAKTMCFTQSSTPTGLARLARLPSAATSSDVLRVSNPSTHLKQPQPRRNHAWLKHPTTSTTSTSKNSSQSTTVSWSTTVGE